MEELIKYFYAKPTISCTGIFNYKLQSYQDSFSLATNKCGFFLPCLGVQIFEGVQIEKVLTKNKSPQVAGVETSHGTILCEYFINCAGQVSELWTASSIQCV